MSLLPPMMVSVVDCLQLRAILDLLPELNQDLRRLQRDLLRAQVCAPEQVPADVVQLHSRVRFVDTLAGKVFELQLCYPDEIRDPADCVSVLSPLGSALLGGRTGQQRHWPLPDKRLAVIQILKVSAPPVAQPREPRRLLVQP